jgi:hypothetical protein
MSNVLVVSPAPPAPVRPVRPLPPRLCRFPLVIAQQTRPVVLDIALLPCSFLLPPSAKEIKKFPKSADGPCRQTVPPFG